MWDRESSCDGLRILLVTHYMSELTSAGSLSSKGLIVRLERVYNFHDHVSTGGVLSL